MQTASGWCNEPLVSLRPCQKRAKQGPGGLGQRRESLDLGARPSLELPVFERALSCSALPEPRRQRAQHHRTSSNRGHVNAAGAVAVCELQQEASSPSLPELEGYESQAHKQQVEEVRLRLEQYWNEAQVCLAVGDSSQAHASSSADLSFNCSSRLQDEPVSQQVHHTETPKAHRSLLEAQWQGHQQVRPQQKRQNAASRSTSSRRARRRALPLTGLPAQRMRVHQSNGPVRVTRASTPARTSDEVLLDRLRNQLVSSRYCSRPNKAMSSICAVKLRSVNFTIQSFKPSV